MDNELALECFFLSPIAGSNDQQRKVSDWLLESVIAPVLDKYLCYATLEREGSLEKHDVVTTTSVSKMLDADLVIADITGAVPSIVYQVGMRQAYNLPLIILLEADSTARHSIVAEQPYIVYVPFGPTNTVRTKLHEAISALLPWPPENDGGNSAERDIPSAVGKRGQLAKRLESIAAAISDLRINSLQEHVEELHQLSRELAAESESSKGVPEAAEKALKIIMRLLDFLGTKRGVETIVAGSVAGVLSLGGWQAVSVYALTLAAWRGKDAFLAALKGVTNRDKK
jgi:hypothetical protein